MTHSSLIDRDRVIEAIMKAEVVATAREMAVPLVEAYLERLEEFVEVREDWKLVSTECGWFIWLDPQTLLMGVVDAIFQSEGGIVKSEFIGCEHKTRRAPKLKRDGTCYAGDDEDGWLEEISQGSQLGFYGLAMRRGRFCQLGVPGSSFSLDLKGREAKIMVRAAIKSSPADFWPEPVSSWQKGLFSFPNEYLDTVERAVLSKAAQIRAARRAGYVPFQLPGIHCTNMYRRTCQFLRTEEGEPGPCRAGVYPPLEAVTVADPSNPAYPVLKEAIAGAGGLIDGRDIAIDDPDLVILTASDYANNSQCLELGRLISGGYFPKVSSLEQEIGTVYHAAVAEITRQVLCC